MRLAIVTAAALTLAACGNGDKADDNVSESAPPQTEVASDSSPAPAEPEAAPAEPLDAGQYCFFRDDENVTEGMELTVGDNGIITGRNYGHIHQEAAAYYASFQTELSNGVQGTGNNVNFEYVTEVDGDTQSGSVVWAVTPERAAPDGLQTFLAATECDGLMDRVFPVISDE